MDKKLLLLLLPILVVSGCTGADAEFVDEYNTKLQSANSLIQEHDRIVSEINSNSGNLELNSERMREYISWVEKNRNAFSEFKLFIEANYQKLNAAGVNPDYVRDNIISVINTMQENELKFQQTLSVQELYGYT